MTFQHGFGFLSFVLLLLLVVADPDVTPSHIDVVNRSSFPEGFVFGASSSAYQYEGAAFEDGKGPSIWDNYTHQYPERIANRSNGDVALDSYNRYKEDVAILKNLGFDGYRFSIAWSRVLPKGKLSGGVNKKGIEYYNNLINELLANGIQPFITLLHFDVPQALEDEYKGFLDHQIVNDFEDYAELCFKEFGDRVKHWTTVNEPHGFSEAAYATGMLAPGRCSSEEQTIFTCLGGDSGIEPYIVSHNEILAHAAAVNVYKTKYQAQQKGVIGISLDSLWFVPYSNGVADKMAVDRILDFIYGWFLYPLTYGDYPPIMRELVKDRLPNFTEAETTLIKGSYDFVGINYYTSMYAQNNSDEPGPKPSYSTDSRVAIKADRNGVPLGPKLDASSWIVDYPLGLYETLVYTKKKYKNPDIYITENGCFDPDGSNMSKLINDTGRINYYHGHLHYLREAIKADVRVKGYFAWSLLDDFEWIQGYTLRFGINYIDYNNNLTRIPKMSAKWFENFLKS